MAVHTDVKVALAHGVSIINAWAAGEHNKIEAGHGPEVAALSAELAKLSLATTAPHSFYGAEVCLKHHGGHQVSLVHGGKFVSSPNADAFERWVLEPTAADANKFYIRNPHHDHGISSSDDGKHVTCSKNRAGWETYRLHPVGNGKYLIIGWNEQRLSFPTDQSTLAQSPNSDTWEQWDIVFAPGAVPAATRLAETQAKIAAARETSKAHLKAEVDRRIAAKQAIAARIESELAQLAA
jgi:hypothetical protein